MPITLNKAVEILTREVHDITLSPDPDVPAALKLGLEAMRAWKNLREGRAGPIDPLLPGEEPEPPCPN
jgi:hypothetical protein